MNGKRKNSDFRKEGSNVDKKEFYRQLMESYTVDAERVKRNAKRKSRNVKSKALVIRRWTVAAAACSVVTAAAVAAVSLGSSGVPHIDSSEGYNITDGGLENARARLSAAEQQYSALSASSRMEESSDLYVSFRKPLKYSEITMVLSVIEDYNDISISLLYEADGSHYDNSSALDDSLSFLGAKISVPVSMLPEVRGLKEITMMEYPESGISDDSFVPINNLPADVTTTPEAVSENINISMPEPVTEPTVTTPATETPTETDPPVTTPAENESETKTEISVAETSVSNTDTSTSPKETTSSVTTDEPVTETSTEASETEEPVFDMVTVPLQGIKTINFINKNHFVATTEDSIRLFRCEKGEIKLETTYYASSAKISSSYDGSKLFIIARDGENMSRLYYADGETSLLSEVDVKYITSGGAELSSVSCSGDGKTVLMRAVSLDKTIVYYGERSEGTISLAKHEYASPVSVLAYSDGTVYTAVTDSKENTVKIYSISAADGTETELASYTGTLKYSRSPDLNMALLTVTGDSGEINVILNKNVLIPVESGNAVFSGKKNDLIMLGGVYYTVTEGGLTETAEEDAKPFFEAVNGSVYEITENGDASVVIQIN